MIEKKIYENMKNEKNIDIRIFAKNENNIYSEMIDIYNIDINDIKISDEYGYICIKNFDIQILNIDDIFYLKKQNIGLNDFLDIHIFHKKDLNLSNKSLKDLNFNIDLF